MIRALRDALRREVRVQIRTVGMLAAVLGVLYALTETADALAADLGDDIDTDGAPSPT